MTAFMALATSSWFFFMSAEDRIARWWICWCLFAISCLVDHSIFISYVVVVFRLILDDPELTEKVKEGGQVLLDLCRKQVRAFDSHLQATGNDLYAGGLHKYEAEVCVGLLYQLYRGNLPDVETSDAPDDLPELGDKTYG